MELRRLTTVDEKFFKQAMELYEQSFPIYEQRLLPDQIDVMNNSEYNFNLIYDQEQFVGLLLYWETQEFIYIEHFCTLPELRGQGYGLKSLAKLAELNKTVILEIDPPLDAISIRRQSFYERAGYKFNCFTHTHPPYRLNYHGHELRVMSQPSILSEDEYKSFFAYLKETVMHYAEINR